MQYAYARVSTAEQHIDAQIAQLVTAGVDPANIHTESPTSGTTRGASRPVFSALLTKLQPGDTLTVVRLDRLGRSLADVVTTMDALTARGIVIRSLGDGIDTSTPAGRMVAGVMASLAAYEREMMLERQRAGLQAARARGTHLGRPHKLTGAQRAEARRKAAEGVPVATVAAILGCSKNTARAAMREVGE